MEYLFLKLITYSKHIMIDCIIKIKKMKKKLEIVYIEVILF
jgi:hypothetical protein